VARRTEGDQQSLYRRRLADDPAPGDFSQTRVGDATDTSPFITDTPKIGISTGGYIENMTALIKYIGAA
jgi:hypothetical protein